MKKTIIFLFGIFIFIYNLSAQFVGEGFNLNNQFLSPPIIYAPDGVKNTVPWAYLDFYVGHSKLFYFEIGTNKPYIINNLVLNENKYYTFNITKLSKSILKTEKYILIPGGDIIVFDILPSFGGMFPAWLKEFPPVTKESQEISFSNIFWYWEDGIKAIKASSVLREQGKDGEIIYDESQLRKTFFGIQDSPRNFNSFKRAWVEGVPGDGLGESLEIEFVVDTDHMMVLNGYVNLKRMDLYTSNNRVKKARIISANPVFEIEYDFFDSAQFSEIVFPQKTRKITFIIEDVYKGTKYSDTCITSIFLKQRDDFKIHEYFKHLTKGSLVYEKKVAEIERELKKYDEISRN